MKQLVVKKAITSLCEKIREDRWVVVDDSHGVVHMVTESFAVLWGLLNESRSERDLMVELCTRYGVDEAIASRDIRDFIGQAKSLGLVEVAGEGAA